MSTATSPALTDRYYFLIRRLHSLFGVIPIGAFLCVHLTINGSILGSGEMFQQNVNRLHMLGPFLVPVEIAFIFVPILFHAIFGVVIWLSGKSNMMQYRYGANIRYTLQRIMGLIVFAFIVYHIWQMHWLGAPFGGAKFDPHNAAQTAAATMQSSAWVAPLYAIGLICTVFHFANGIWTFLITWGITIGPRSQVYFGVACAIFGVLLGLLGLGSLAGLKAYQPNEQPVHVAASQQQQVSPNQ